MVSLESYSSNDIFQEAIDQNGLENVDFITTDSLHNEIEMLLHEQADAMLSLWPTQYITMHSHPEYGLIFIDEILYRYIGEDLEPVGIMLPPDDDQFRQEIDGRQGPGDV